MATINSIPARIDARATMTLTEAEMRALKAMTAYGVESFLRQFYKNLGDSCLRPHEAGMRSLFRSIEAQLPPILRRVDNARNAFNDTEASQ